MWTLVGGKSFRRKTWRPVARGSSQSYHGTFHTISTYESQEKLKAVDSDRSNAFLVCTIYWSFVSIRSQNLNLQTTPRLSTELDAKLTSFKAMFDSVLKAQGDAMQFEHTPSQSVPHFWMDRVLNLSIYDVNFFKCWGFKSPNFGSCCAIWRKRMSSSIRW